MVRLSINSWPPVASHLICLLCGIGLTNIQRTEQAPLHPRFKNMVIIPVQKAQFELLAAFRAGDRVALVQEKKKVNKDSNVLPSPPCLLDAKSALLVQVTPYPALGVPFSEAPALWKMGRGKARIPFRVVLAQDRAKYKPCSQRAQVSYGPNAAS